MTNVLLLSGTRILPLNRQRLCGILPFLSFLGNLFDDNLSDFEAWAWASCPDTGTYYKFANGYPDSTSEFTLPNQHSPPDGAGEPDWSYASGSYARGQSWHARGRVR